MSIKHLVSVIIPAYNAQDYIAEALRSILSQTYSAVEIVVVDDGSTDQTAEIVENFFPKVQLLKKVKNSGLSDARNYGIINSKGDLICFLDADDLMLPERIILQVDFLDRHANVSLVFCDYRNFDESGYYTNSHFQTCPHLLSQLKSSKEIIIDDACNLLSIENFGIAGSFLFRRNLLHLETLFETSLKSCEDFHFYFRLARHTSVGVINKVGLMRRLHINNLSSNIETMRLEGIRSRRMLIKYFNDTIISKNLEKYILICKLELARYYADKACYFLSIKYDLKVIFGIDFIKERSCAIRNIIRTFLIATGLLSRILRARKLFN
jgi:glycosyltransferase involved in cell wall biosynthesis